MTSPAEVLDRQADLVRRWRHPSADMVAYVQDYAKACDGRGGGSAAAMFYPALASQSLRESAAWCTLVAADLEQAATYQVTGNMVDVLHAVYRKTMTGLEHLEAAELPSEYGFLWYDVPVAMTDVWGKQVSIRAVSWGAQHMFTPGRDAFGRHVSIEGDGARVLLWALHTDPNEYAAEHPWEADRALATLGELQLDHVMTFPFGEKFDLAAYTASEGESERASSALHYVHVTFMLLQSEIAAHHRPQVSHGVRRRVTRSLRSAEVTVVTLRRALQEREDGPGGHRVVDWSCRWLVQGHWRHLEAYDGEHHRAVAPASAAHCTVCGGRVTWVRPAMKGPSWLPLKQPKVVHRLSR